MKKTLLSFVICFSAALVWSCNNSGSSSETTDSSTTSTADTSGTSSNTMATNTPLNNDDSSFVMKAGAGGMMEVQAGQLAQQQASNPRVKDFGNMMVTDHGQANDQLKSTLSGRVDLPGSLPADMQKKVDQLKGLKGTAFDKKYVSMMVDDHKEDVSKFKDEADKANDPQLKQWVQNTLPVLQKHLDSIQAIKKDLHY